MNNAINEIKNTLEATKNRITEAEDKISELEDRRVEINESERKKEKWIKRNEDNLRDLQDNMKHSNIRITGVPEEDKKKDHSWLHPHPVPLGQIPSRNEIHMSLGHAGRSPEGP